MWMSALPYWPPCLFRRAAQSLRLHRQNRDRLDLDGDGHGFTGLLVRWRESHLLGADIGHIPVSNLYKCSSCLR